MVELDATVSEPLARAEASAIQALNVLATRHGEDALRLARWDDPRRRVGDWYQDARITTAVVEALTGLSMSTWRALEAGLQRIRTDLAVALAADPAFLPAAAALRPALRVGAIGDSNTADAISWIRLLDAALRRRDAGAVVELDNRAMSGDSSHDGLGEAIALAAGPQLDLVFVWIGKNDRRIPSPLDRALVSTQTTVEHLVSIAEVLRSVASRVVFLAPLGVSDDLVARSDFLRRRGIRYRMADIAALRSAMNDAGFRSVAVDPAFNGLALDEVLESDGVHLNPRGQVRLARWAAGLMAAHLGDRSPAGGGPEIDQERDPGPSDSTETPR